jgi:hypothetical protein
MKTAKFPRLTAMLLACAGLCGACGSDAQGGDTNAARATPASRPASVEATVLRLRAAAAPGKLLFDKKRLRANAGTIVLELTNPTQLGHNVRIQTGEECCSDSGSGDVGGTQTIGKGTTRATLELEPGRYWFLCSVGNHWRRGQRGRLVVR